MKPLHEDRSKRVAALFVRPPGDGLAGWAGPAACCSVAPGKTPRIVPRFPDRNARCDSCPVGLSSLPPVGRP